MLRQILANVTGFVFSATDEERESDIDGSVDFSALEALFLFELSAISASATPPTALMVAAMTVAVAASTDFLPTVLTGKISICAERSQGQEASRRRHRQRHHDTPGEIEDISTER
jgi:hypothetical protein